MRKRIDLGGEIKDFDSRQSREDVINAYLETDKDGRFSRLVGTPGFVDFITLGDGPLRGMYVASDVLYVVSGDGFYKVIVTPVGSVQAELKGTVAGFSGAVRLSSVGTDLPEVMALTNARGFVYKNVDDSFAEVTDLDFDPDFSVTSFNQRFWFNKPNSNEFFASDILDGFTYDSLFFASAENNPDKISYVQAMNTGIYLFGSSTVEHWQDTQRGDFSLRRVTGATLDRGIGARASLVRWENTLFYLADDFTIRTLGAGSKGLISGLSFAEDVALYSFPERAEGFFVDSPRYKAYCLSFPTEGVTWCYDVLRDMWHKRESKDVEGWRINTASLIFDKVILGDKLNGNLYSLDENEYTEAGVTMKTVWTTPPVRVDEASFTVSRLEIFAEVGVGLIGNVDPVSGIEPEPLDPKIGLRISRDGGNNWISKSNKSLGRIGDFKNKIIWRDIGRIRRGQNLVFEFTISDDVKREIYAGYIDADIGVG